MREEICKICEKSFLTNLAGKTVVCSTECREININNTKRRYYKKNKEKVIRKAKENNKKEGYKKKRKEYREKNKVKIYERHKNFRLNNKDKEAMYGKKYRNTEKGKLSNIKRSNQRRARKLKAHPKWANNDKILEVYELAKELQWLSEEKLEVDHIIPLQSDVICGLHVDWNLQILPRSMNRSKGNKLIVNRRIE